MANRIDKQYSDDVFSRVKDMTEDNTNSIGYFEAGLLFAVTYPQDTQDLLRIIEEHLPWEIGGRASRAQVTEELRQLLHGYGARVH